MTANLVLLTDGVKLFETFHNHYVCFTVHWYCQCTVKHNHDSATWHSSTVPLGPIAVPIIGTAAGSNELGMDGTHMFLVVLVP